MATIIKRVQNLDARRMAEGARRSMALHAINISATRISWYPLVSSEVQFRKSLLLAY